MKNITNSPLVSVLMPSYNSADLIGIAIQSVINSTYENWELIITDDRSTDKTLEIAQNFAERDSRITVIKNEKNYGDYPNRNQAASYARGKYIKYVDHDDYIYPFGLEQLVYYMEQFPDAGYGLCSIEQHKSKIFPVQLLPSETYSINYFEQELFHKAPLSSIIRKDAFDAVGGFTGKAYLGDFEMWHILSKKYPVVLMPHGIVWYRVHANQESSRLKKDPRKQFEYFVVGKALINESDVPLSDKYKQQITKMYEVKQAQAIVSALKHHGISKCKELKKVSQLNWQTILKLRFFQ